MKTLRRLSEIIKGQWNEYIKISVGVWGGSSNSEILISVVNKIGPINNNNDQQTGSQT